jgi:non-reducing end alpha-L-arabinofuranosidase
MSWKKPLASIALGTAGLIIACGGKSENHFATAGRSSSGAAGSGSIGGASGAGEASGGTDPKGGSPQGGESPGEAGAGSGGAPVAGTGSGGVPAAGTGATGGTTSDTGGSAAGGAEAGGESGDGGTMGGAGGSAPVDGPCDIFRDGGQPCVAAYSTVRRLSAIYAGPLYQIRSDSSAENTGSGGQAHDVGQTEDGFADAATVEATCADTICTVSLLYDQSGNGNHLPVAKAGIIAGGPHAGTDDFESSATKGALTVGGHPVFSLYMEPRQGYRLPERGTGVPDREGEQGIYLLADGTRSATGCCWEFGNVGPVRTFNEPVSLFFGADTGNRGAGDGPWFMADFGGGIWSGGTNWGDPGWGADSSGVLRTPNPGNPSMRSSFALGFLKTNMVDYGLRMADVTTANRLTTAYRGAVPKRIFFGGTVVLGVNQDNSNASWGTFYEGAVVAGFPADETEELVLENIRAAGYGQ